MKQAAGICDDDVAICYCDGPMGRIPAPEGSPPGTPPTRVGRPLVTFHHAPSTTWDGRPAFGEVSYDKVYGPKGYCNVTDPPWVPGCGMDGWGGRTCDTPVEAFCPGGCSGHGTCYIGWCMCDEGYYGHDCARRKAGMPLLRSRIDDKPWVKRVLGSEPPAAIEPPPRPTRRRPLIYVYDLEPMYQAKIMQYRVTPRWCVHRTHTAPNNDTDWTDVWVYAADTLLHESLLISEHRTFNPEERLAPKYGVPSIPDSLQIGCHLSRSNTAFLPDRYDEDFTSPIQPDGFVQYIKGHPCYNPEKIYKMAKEGGWAEKHRFFIGDGEDVRGEYTELLSRANFCLVAPGDGWSARMEDAVLHGCIPVIIADGVHAVFESLLDVDAFALRLPQEQVPRLLEILLAVPPKTIRSKQAHLGRVWHRFRYASLPGLAAELRRAGDDNRARWAAKDAAAAATQQRRRALQQEGAAAAGTAAGNNGTAAGKLPLPRPYKGEPSDDDAFATILQWLHSRIPYARGEDASG
ncbi:hypothetical protein GPECTOR_26g598 [Gonium pectorale]|uniref:Exostosin GT47 domain-containing protein n=1 Tax=Gonium pectorale TaxID=33097 RepID=A0A150GGG3_GONPE|nr:hypothetical protein GPECTOR_26g598 [Gonium pectorale]|eukprot:KXZ48695.1 hypothetical protein GPECTOR_26g598 [Gonium pectorale]